MLWSVILLQLGAILLLGLICGSELNIAAFAHPTLSRQSLDVHIPVRAALAKCLGRVMPFWMTASAFLNLLLLLPVAHVYPPYYFGWKLAAASAAIQVVAIVFSLAALVPINNRITRWTPQNTPDDWTAQERRWDAYHWIRTCGLILAFALLTFSALLR